MADADVVGSAAFGVGEMRFAATGPATPRRREESDVLLRIAAHLFHEEQIRPRGLCLTQECATGVATETLVGYGVPGEVVREIVWLSRGADYAGEGQDGTLLTLEAKGCQANNHGLYAGDAVRKALREWTGEREHRVAIACADHPAYRSALAELSAALRTRLGLWLYLLLADDAVLTIAPDVEVPGARGRFRRLVSVDP